MASSPTPTSSVDPESPLVDVADPIVRYSPVALVIDVVRLLRGRGLAVADTYDHLGDLVHTFADRLRRRDGGDHGSRDADVPSPADSRPSQRPGHAVAAFAPPSIVADGHGTNPVDGQMCRRHRRATQVSVGST